MRNASVHDSQVFADLLDNGDSIVFADSAYTGAELHRQISKSFPNGNLDQSKPELTSIPSKRLIWTKWLYNGSIVKPSLLYTATIGATRD